MPGNVNRIEDLSPIIKSVLAPQAIEVLLKKVDANKRLLALEKYADNLLCAGFTKTQLSDIIRLPLGDKKIDMLGKCVNIFLGKVFNHQQLFQILSTGDGYKNIETLAEYVTYLLEIGFGSLELFLIVLRKYGYKNIKALAMGAALLLDLKFSCGQLVQIVLRYGGYKDIKVLVGYAKSMLQAGFSTYQVVELRLVNTKKNRGEGSYSKNIEFLANYAPAFLKRGFSTDQLLQLVLYCPDNIGLKNLYNSLEHKKKEICTNFPHLSTKARIDKLREDFTPAEGEAQVMEIVSSLQLSNKSKGGKTASSKSTEPHSSGLISATLFSRPALTESRLPSASTEQKVEVFDKLQRNHLYLFNQPLICADINSLMRSYPFDDEEGSNDRAILAETSDLNLG